MPAVAYFMLAQLTVLLTAPPGEPSIIWPPAGLAIVILMLMGKSALPSLFAGMLAHQLYFWFQGSPDTPTYLKFILGGTISLGVMLQAVIAVRLVNRHVGPDDPLIDDRSILRFLLIVGPLSSLIACSTAVVCFALFKTIPIAELGAVWLTWWLGDSIGAMIVTPLLLSLIKFSPVGHFNRRVSVGIPMLGLLLVIGLLFVYTGEREEDERNQLFTRQAGTLHLQLVGAFQESFQLLNMTRSFLESGGYVSKDEFATFGQGLLDQSKGIQALEWIPRVASFNRISFENANDGPGDIKVFNGDKVERASEKPVYYPVKYVQPLIGNERAYGYDVSSNPMAKDAQDYAFLYNSIGATAPIRLIQESGQQAGLVVYLSMSQKGKEHIWDNHLGFVAMVYRAEDFITSHLLGPNSGLSRQIYVRISDVTDEVPKELYRSPRFAESIKDSDDQRRIKRLFLLGGRQWEFEYLAANETLYKDGVSSSWLILSAGMLFASLICGWLLTLTGRTVRVGELVNEKTANLQHEIEERRSAELALRKLSKAVEYSPYMVVISRLDGIVEYASPKVLEVTGFSEEEVVGQPINMLHYDQGQETSYASIWVMLKSTREWQGELLNLRKNGQAYWANVHIAPIYDEEDHVTHYVSIHQDITEAREISEQLNYQASHDQLTDLVNRRAFELLLEKTLEHSQVTGEQHVFCFLDLDQFKVVNDTCGHIAGDELLRQLAHMLQERIRSGDTLARLGGDEFGILMRKCNLQQAEKVANDLREKIASFKFSWESQIFSVGVSIGVVEIDKHSVNKIELMKQADSACYTAKENGRNRIHLYQQDDAMLLKREGEMQWVSEINAALDEDRFVLFGQIILPLQDSSLKPDMEVLLRLRDKDGNLVPPGAFLPAVERYHLSSRVDRWVVEHTLDWLEQNAKAFSRTIGRCAINLSGGSLGDNTIQEAILQRLEASSIPASTLKFEITETSAIANLADARDFINALKAFGCQFSLDDFGSGLSSFAYLKNLPVDTLKIDGIFVKEIVENKLDLAMVKSINEIGHVMGMQTVAEFVENDAIVELLREIGIDYGQGYGLGRPKPLDELLTEQQKNRALEVTDHSV